MIENNEQHIARFLSGEGRKARPAHFGTRFNDKAEFLPEPGNTIVAHVADGSKTQNALIDLRCKMLALPGAGHFAFTPVSSYHMTVFQGVIEYRRREGFWPPELPLDATIDAATAHMIERLKDLPKSQRFKVKPIAVTPMGLSVAGATPEDERALRAFRDRLADCFGYRHPDHEAYEFHITMAYLIDFMVPDEARDHARAIAALSGEFLSQITTIELGTSDFCTFDDMNHFEPVVSVL